MAQPKAAAEFHGVERKALRNASCSWRLPASGIPARYFRLSKESLP